MLNHHKHYKKILLDIIYIRLLWISGFNLILIHSSLSNQNNLEQNNLFIFLAFEAYS